MGDMRRVATEVNASTAKMIDDLVREGRFRDEAEVFRHALRLLGEWVNEQEDAFDRARNTHGADRLRDLVEEGLASGFVESELDA